MSPGLLRQPGLIGLNASVVTGVRHYVVRDTTSLRDLDGIAEPRGSKWVLSKAHNRGSKRAGGRLGGFARADKLTPTQA